jgi:anti-sigma regulatory factor (Ser/Thr protein kinase)
MSALTLEPEPRSVRIARSWVVEELTDLGREDLAEAAALGVSELVTNALLHAEPPIRVRLGGTSSHPRVEVHDSSTSPPDLDADALDEDDEHLMRTFGRGLGLVALYSSRWGADVSGEGKVVWFEPAEEPGLDAADSAGDVFVLDEAVEERLAEAAAPVRLVPVRLLGMPVAAFARFRGWYLEVRRELRLLALAHPESYPVAAELAALTVQVEAERAQARGVEELDAAIAEGRERVDLEYQVPPTTPVTMRLLSDALDRVDLFCRDHLLLTLPEDPETIAVRRWYFGEFSRQAEGHPPTPFRYVDRA